MSTDHFNQPQRRKAEFINPPNIIKTKVGHGGLAEDTLDIAQLVIENNTTDFTPVAQKYLNTIMKGIKTAESSDPYEDGETLIANMLYPAMQLKANGGMFKYSLISEVADKLIQFLEVIEHPDDEVLHIVKAYHTTMRIILAGKLTGDGGDQGKELKQELMKACYRYFEKHPENIDLRDELTQH